MKGFNATRVVNELIFRNRLYSCLRYVFSHFLNIWTDNVPDLSTPRSNPGCFIFEANVGDNNPWCQAEQLQPCLHDQHPCVRVPLADKLGTDFLVDLPPCDGLEYGVWPLFLFPGCWVWCPQHSCHLLHRLCE